MSERDPDMEEILDDIRTLSRGETPGPRKAPRVPRMGLKSMFLAMPAAALAVVTFVEMKAWLDLPAGDFGDIAVFLPVFVMSLMGDDARPTSTRHWGILGTTWLAAGMASALAAIFVGWLFARFAPDSLDGAVAVVAAFTACAAAILLTFLTADRLFRKDNIIFPRDAEEAEGGTG